MNKNSLTPCSQQPNWKEKRKCCWNALPPPKTETSKPSPSMPTKILRNQCNSIVGKTCGDQPRLCFSSLSHALQSPTKHTWASLLQNTGIPQRYCSSVPDHCNKARCNLFAGGGSWLQFVKNTKSEKYNKMRYACIGSVQQARVPRVTDKQVPNKLLI